MLDQAREQRQGGLERTAAFRYSEPTSNLKVRSLKVRSPKSQSPKSEESEVQDVAKRRCGADKVRKVHR